MSTALGRLFPIQLFSFCLTFSAVKNTLPLIIILYLTLFQCNFPALMTYFRYKTRKPHAARGGCGAVEANGLGVMKVGFLLCLFLQIQFNKTTQRRKSVKKFRFHTKVTQLPEGEAPST